MRQENVLEKQSDQTSHYDTGKYMSKPTVRRDAIATELQGEDEKIIDVTMPLQACYTLLECRC